MLTGIVFNSCEKIKTNKSHDLNDVLKAGRLKVVTDSCSYGLQIKNDSIYGLQYEIIKAFADSLGVELQISVQNDMLHAITDIEKGECDIIANMMPVTSQYKKVLAFTQPIITTRLMLVQRIDNDTVKMNNAKSQSDLGNDTIYVPANSPSISRLENLSNEIAETIHIEQVKNVTVEEMIRRVSEGKIKNTICPEQFAKKYQIQYNNLDFSLPLGFNQNYSWAVNKKSINLLRELNEFLTFFVGSADYWKIYRKYN